MSPEVASRHVKALPRLHVVTDDSVLGRERWSDDATEVLAAGGSAVALHVRGPHSDGGTIYRLVEALESRARRSGGWLIVNDRVDIALVMDVHGVHVGSRSLPVRAVRALLGPNRSLGCSCRHPGSAAEAGTEGADYVFLGTIFETPGHPGVQGMGPEGLAAAVGAIAGLPAIGIGGIDPERARSVLEAGAYGVAVVRGVWDAEDPASAVRDYLSAMTNGRKPE